MDARAAWREAPTAAAHLEQVRQELASLRQELAVADRQMDEATRTMHRLARDPPLARRPTSPPDTQPLRLAQARHGAAGARQREIGKAITRLEAQVTRWSTHREEGSSP